MQFFDKSGKFVCWRPPPGGLVPLLRGILDPPLNLTKMAAPPGQFITLQAINVLKSRLFDD